MRIKRKKRTRKRKEKEKKKPGSHSGAMGEPQPRSTPPAASTSLPNLTSFKEKITEREFLFLSMSSRSWQDKARWWKTSRLMGSQGMARNCCDSLLEIEMLKYVPSLG